MDAERNVPGKAESRKRYSLTHLHAKGGMGQVWLRAILPSAARSH